LYDFFNSIRDADDELEQWLDNYSKLKNKPFHFIQVGASDGLRWDPIRKFIIRDKWKGVLVEPIKPVYELLRSNYSYLKHYDLQFENCAISPSEGSIKFWSYSEHFLKPLNIEDRLYYLRKSSLDKVHVENSLSNITNCQDFIKCYETVSLPLQRIIEKHFLDKDIDLIFIDAEGFDDQVIRTIDFDKCTPNVIIYENHNLGENNRNIENYLSRKGYSITKVSGDTIAQFKS
jgi:FkbM family methyltransferase